MARRHNSALWVPCFLLFAGCFADHGRGAEERPDAGTTPEADAGPGCRIEPATARIVECPPSTVAAGADVTVAIEHGIGPCCDVRSSDIAVAHAGNDHTITSIWSVCDCCDGCRCATPTEIERVSLGALPPGMHTVHAGETTCAFWVTETECGSVDADEIRAPRVLFPDQAFSATIRRTSFHGCGCTPSATEIPDAVILSVCGCCEACDCIDPGYEVGYTGGLVPVGEHHLSIAGNEVPLTVAERATCSPREPSGLEIVGPDPSLTPGGERLWWAVVRGSEPLCCADPAPAVDQTRAGLDIALTLYSCAIDPCLCIGEPQPFEAWHSLGELAPGTYTVRMGSLVQTFSVP